MSSFQNFISYAVKHGFARSNRFQVIIPLPNALLERVANVEQSKTSSFFGEDVIKLINSFSGGSEAEISRGLELMVQETTHPSKNLPTSEIKYNGDFYKLPYSINYETHTFYFRVSRDMYEKNIIDEWMNLVVNPVSHEVGYLDDYSVNITINQLDQNDNIVYSVVLEDAYPVSVAPIQLSNEEQNNIVRLSSTFAYKRWFRMGERESKGGQDGITSLSQTPFGPILAPILSNPAVQRGLDYIENTTGLDLEGEAVNIYNQVDDIVRDTTGTSINKTVSLLEALKAATQINDKIPAAQKAKVIDYITNVLDKINKG